MRLETWGGKGGPLVHRNEGGRGARARCRGNNLGVKAASGLGPGSDEKLYKVTVLQVSRAVGLWQSKTKLISRATEVKCRLVVVEDNRRVIKRFNG